MPDQDYTVDEKARTRHPHRRRASRRSQKRLGDRQPLRPERDRDAAPREPGPARAHALQARRQLRGEGRRGLIVDEFTGRMMPGRRWSDGLHQAVEAKEGVKIEKENQTLATITFQNFFRMYNEAGGHDRHRRHRGRGVRTRSTSSTSRVVPTNRPMVRKDIGGRRLQDRAREVRRGRRGDRGAATRRASRCWSARSPSRRARWSPRFLKKKGIPHNVLNAKQHEREAEIVAQAGRKGAVTISTNMAGRGTDILLGGNPELMAKAEVGPSPTPPEPATATPADLEAHQAAWRTGRSGCERRVEKYQGRPRASSEEVLALGGLHILGTERHESRRIDNQLRGRAGRQGDPGVSQVLPVARRRPDAHLRVGAHHRPDGAPGDGGGRAHRAPLAQQGHRERAEEGRGPQLRHPQEPARVRRRDEPAARTIYKLRRQVLAAGAGVALVEFDEDKKTKAKIRSEHTITWEDFREMVLDALEDVVARHHRAPTAAHQEPGHLGPGRR